MNARVEEVALRLRADGVLETNRGLALTAGELDKVGKAATAAAAPLQQVGVSAGQTRQAMRQLPAQITDIWTSLASGQAPMTVAIQQGGQIKDSFGGVIPAARAMAGALGPLGLAAAGAAGGIGLLAMAYIQAQQEGDAFARSIILTGNAAGTSMSQLDGMARSLGNVVGTQHQAADVLAQLTGTGRVAAASLQSFADVAIRLDRVGIPVADTVKQFAELGKSPVEASVKLNEQTNYLTKAIYDQIVALEKRGRTAEAADLAQTAYANAMRSRADELEARLGTLERAWKMVGNAASATWDFMLGIGREDTLNQQLEKAQKEVDALQQRLTDAKVSPVRAAGIKLMERELEVARQNLETLRMQVYMEGEVAAAQGAATQRNRQQVGDAEAARRARAAGTTAADRALAERIALLNRVYGGMDGNELARDAFRRSELGGTNSVDAALRDAQRQAAEDRQKAIDNETKLIDRQAQSIERETAALANHTGELGLNAEQLLARRQALVDQQIAEAAALLSVTEGADGYDEQTQALRRQIAALRELRQAQGQAFVRQQAVDAEKAAEKARADEEAQARRRSESISASIEDGIMNGFRKGKSFADIFISELQAQFARTVLRPIISPVADALAGVGGGGGGGGGGILGSLFSSLFGGAGSGAGAGFSLGEFGAGADFSVEAIGMLLHGGGVPGTDRPAFTRALPASTWAKAPRFHSGVGPDELPAVIKRDEGVFTAGQMRAMAPVSEMAKAGGGQRINYAPTFNVDSRTDRAEVLAQMALLARQSQAELLDMMDRRQA